MGLSCLPQHRKRGRPPKVRSSVGEIIKTFRDYAVHLPASGKAHIASMIASFYYKEKAHNPHFEGLKDAESLDVDNEITRTLQSLAHQAGSFPTAAEAEEQLLRFESWVPPTMLRLRNCFTTAATVFVYYHYGRYRYKHNTRFAELFESEEQAMAADHDVSSYRLSDLWAGFESLAKADKTGISRALPHSLMSRVVSTDSYLEFSREGIQGTVSDKVDGVTEVEGIHEMESRCGKILCHVGRHMWMAPGGTQGAYFMAIQPLPNNKYLAAAGSLSKSNPTPSSKKRARTAESAVKKEEVKLTKQEPTNNSADGQIPCDDNLANTTTNLCEPCNPKLEPKEAALDELESTPDELLPDMLFDLSELFGN